MLRVAINGYGRIGRSVLRALYESNARQWVQVIAINEQKASAVKAVGCDVGDWVMVGIALG